MSRLRVTAVSYLNTKPFLYGIFNSGLDQEMDLSLDIPSVCAQKLLSGEADLGLVPVVTIPAMDRPVVISDYCIGADGPVRTVAIFSEVPVSRIKRLLLDFHSRTSVELVKLLLREYWQVSPRLIPAQEGFIEEIGGDTAGLVIGDRTFALDQKFPFSYDLGLAWKDWTGLPFVFAAWVSRRPLPDDFVRRFNEALARGIELIPQLIALMPKPVIGMGLEDYFRHQISYVLDTTKKEALALFLGKIAPIKEALVFQ